MQKLATKYAENWEILEAELDGSARKGSNKVTQDQKNDIWLKITNTVNSLGFSSRSVLQMKRKHTEIKSSGKFCVELLWFCVCYC